MLRQGFLQQPLMQVTCALQRPSLPAVPQDDASLMPQWRAPSKLTTLHYRSTVLEIDHSLHSCL